MAFYYPPTNAAVVTAVRHANPDAIPYCGEIPDPDHIHLELAVDSVTGGRNPLSALPQFDLTTPMLTPEKKPEVPKANYKSFRANIQTRPLGRTKHTRSKIIRG